MSCHVKLDDCIVLNEHNTVFATKRSAIFIYLLFIIMYSKITSNA